MAWPILAIIACTSKSQKMDGTSSNSYDSKVPEYIRIPWTQEREDFFNQVFNNFEMFKDKLEAFFDTLNPEMIDTHIQTFKMLS